MKGIKASVTVEPQRAVWPCNVPIRPIRFPAQMPGFGPDLIVIPRKRGISTPQPLGSIAAAVNAESHVLGRQCDPPHIASRCRAAVMSRAALTFADDNGLLPASANPNHPIKVTPMGNAYKSTRCARRRCRRHPPFEFSDPRSAETTRQDLDYFVWLIRGPAARSLFDTASMPKRRRRARASSRSIPSTRWRISALRPTRFAT